MPIYIYIYINIYHLEISQQSLNGLLWLYWSYQFFSSTIVRCFLFCFVLFFSPSYVFMVYGKVLANLITFPSASAALWVYFSSKHCCFKVQPHRVASTAVDSGNLSNFSANPLVRRWWQMWKTSQTLITLA